ncbi:type I toxin-antitoxin system Fst family toxin (plasmid) [Apilactobacillus kunkeei]|nr:type I toxin-antitoxin system Fst family toxin [Apilactobacillus kunkeei]QYU55173.1 type I toxin-antitoxin system Fst family toxin [Apilactobacillus kunkeei]
MLQFIFTTLIAPTIVGIAICLFQHWINKKK